MAVSPRRAREIARTRGDILQAAARAFANRGFANATMQDIAREAGYTAASLYSYFSSKEEIIRALLESVRGEIDSLFSMAIPGGLSLRQKLEMLIGRQLEIATRHLDAIRFFHFSAGQGFGAGPCHAPMEDVPSKLEMMAGDYERFLRANAEPGDLGDWDPGEAALAFAGLLHGFFLRWLRSPEAAEGTHDGIRRMLDLFFHGVRGPTNPQ